MIIWFLYFWLLMMLHKRLLTLCPIKHLRLLGYFRFYFILERIDVLLCSNISACCGFCLFLYRVHIIKVSALGQTPSTTSLLTHSWGVSMRDIIILRLQALRGHFPVTVPKPTPFLPARSFLPAESCLVLANRVACSTNSVCHVGSVSTVQSGYENHNPPHRDLTWHAHAPYTR